MSGASSGFDPQELWQARPRTLPPITLGEVQRRARTFKRQARRREIEGWAGIIVCILCFATVPYAWRTGANWMVLVGASLCLAGGMLSCWRWRRMNSAEPLPEDGKALVESYRRNLIRLHDLRRNVFLRIYLPMLPGAALAFTGRLVEHNSLGLPDATDHLIGILLLIVMGLVIAVGWLANQRIADKLQRKIEEL